MMLSFRRLLNFSKKNLFSESFLFFFVSTKMVRHHSSSKIMHSSLKSMIKSNSNVQNSPMNTNQIDHVDDETKMAKRHLTKEMWQLVSIAVKRMADELINMYSNQQTPSTAQNTEVTNNGSSNYMIGTSLEAKSPLLAQILEMNHMKSLNPIQTGAGDSVSSKISQHVVHSNTQASQITSDKLKKKSGIHKARRFIKSKVQQQPIKKKKSTTSRGRTNTQQKQK